MSEFNYMELWALEEPMQKPHDRRAAEFGISIDDIPVSPVLTRFEDSLNRIMEMYNVFELEEDGIDVEQLLDKYTELQVMEYLKEMGFENAVSMNEAEILQMCDDWLEIIQLPKTKSDFYLLKQFEETPNGKVIDVSAFNTMDFLRGQEDFEFDKYRYFTDKVAEKAEDLAIMHSCITDAEGRNNVRKRFEALVNSKFGNSASWLTARIKECNDLGEMSELVDKLHEKNRQIRRLQSIWNKYAYNW